MTVPNKGTGGLSGTSYVSQLVVSDDKAYREVDNSRGRVDNNRSLDNESGLSGGKD